MGLLLWWRSRVFEIVVTTTTVWLREVFEKTICALRILYSMQGWSNPEFACLLTPRAIA